MLSTLPAASTPPAPHQQEPAPPPLHSDAPRAFARQLQAAQNADGGGADAAQNTTAQGCKPQHTGRASADAPAAQASTRPDASGATATPPAASATPATPAAGLRAVPGTDTEAAGGGLEDAPPGINREPGPPDLALLLAQLQLHSVAAPAAAGPQAAAPLAAGGLAEAEALGGQPGHAQRPLQRSGTMNSSDAQADAPGDTRPADRLPARKPASEAGVGAARGVAETPFKEQPQAAQATAPSPETATGAATALKAIEASAATAAGAALAWAAATGPAATAGLHPLDGGGPAGPTHAQLPAALGSPEFAPQLGLQISTFVRDGVQHAQLHLNPADMGPVTVQIQLDGQAAQVHLLAEQAPTRQALEQAMPQLAGSLREAGLTLTGGGVFQQPRHTAGGSGGQEARTGSGRGRVGAVESDKLDNPASNGTRGLPAARRRGVVDLMA